jgi:WD40 repeat protein
MPEDHKSLANWLIRRYEATLTEIADHVGHPAAAVEVTLDKLINQGLVKAVNDTGEVKYRVNLAPKSGRQMPKDIYKVLDTSSSQKANVFISYSRRNKAFVERLHASLEATEREVWVDWENIPLAVDWWKEIELGIELADTFIFVLSPDSVQSKVCGQEIEHAVRHNKRLVPVLHQDVVPDQVHPELARLNWIFMRSEDDFEVGLQGLLAALDQNIEYVRTHTRILLRALEWDHNNRDTSYLLRGKDLQQANDYLVQGRDEEPKPTPLHNQYVLASADLESANREAEMHRQSTLLTNQRRWLRLVTAVSILTVGLGLTSLGLHRQTEVARQAAEQAEIEALSRSAEALSLSDQRFDALLTATQAGYLLESHSSSQKDAALYATVTSALRQALFWVYERNRFDGHTGTVWKVEVAPGGDVILSAGADGTVRLWTLDGTLVRQLEEARGSIQDATLSPDGKTIAAVDIDGHVYLWTTDGTLQREWSAHSGQAARAVQFSPDGTRLATGGEDAQVYLWQVETGNLIQALSSHRDTVQAIAFQPDGQSLIVGDSEGWLYHWSLAGDRQQEIQAHQGPIHSLAWQQDTLAVGSHDQQVSLWRVPPGAAPLVPLNRFEAHEGPVNQVIFTPEGDSLITAGLDKAIYLWTRGGQRQATLAGHTGQVTSVAIHPNGNTVISGGGDRSVRLWELNRPHITVMQDHQEAVYAVDVSADGESIASVGADETLRLWSAEGDRQATLSDADTPLLAVAFYPDGQQVVAGGADGYLYTWRRDGKLLSRLKAHEGAIQAIAISPDGQTLASAGDDRIIKLWDPEDNSSITASPQLDSILALDFSLDGRTLAAGGHSQSVYLWPIDAPQIQELIGHRGSIFDVKFSPDGQTLASTSEDNTVRLWNAESGNLLTVLEGHQDGVRAIAFNPAPAFGAEIATASNDNTLRFWNFQGNLLATLSGHGGGVNDIIFEPSGSAVISASSDHTVILWQLAYTSTLEDLLNYSCRWLRNYLRTNNNATDNVKAVCGTTAAQLPAHPQQSVALRPL